MYTPPMNPSENDFVCPVCDRPMRLATVLRHAPRLGGQEQKVMGLDDAIAEFAAEAVPPDVKRAKG
jgi:hypothetical protein